jgi:hypothetical protein
MISLRWIKASGQELMDLRSNKLAASSMPRAFKAVDKGFDRARLVWRLGQSAFRSFRGQSRSTPKVGDLQARSYATIIAESALSSK